MGVHIEKLLWVFELSHNTKLPINKGVNSKK